jgi:SNF2 family DNA or RNA helicase
MTSKEFSHPGLHLDLDDQEQIVVSRGSDVDDVDWVRVASAFGANQYRSGLREYLVVEPGQFEAQSSWLGVWQRENRIVTWAPMVAQLLNQIRTGTAAFQKLVLSNPDRFIGTELAIPGLLKPLTIQQIENVHCLLDMPNGSNFSVPGAGKTLTTLSVWALLRDTNRVDKLLVICPRSAFESWEGELEHSFSFETKSTRYTGGPIDQSADVVLVNFEQLENVTKLSTFKRYANSQNLHLVIDEAHRIKGGGRSVRWRACRAISEIATRVDVLTGTPMPNGPLDLQALFAVTWPKLSRKQLSPDSLSTMKRKTTFVRTTKSELGLPPVNLQPVVGEPTELHRQILDALRDRYSGIFDLSVSDSKFLARKGRAVMSMLAATTNPGLLVRKEFNEIEFGVSWPPLEIQNDASLGDLIREYLNHEVPWKFEFVVDKVAQLANLDRKVIVWSSFVGNIAALKRYLSKFEPAVVFGGTPTLEREAEIARFRNDPSCRVLLTNPQTLGEGISLHMECNDAIYLDRTYNAGLYLQSLDRIHRLGLPADTETNVTFLVTNLSIDERVSQRLAAKISNLSRFLDDESLVAASIPTADEMVAEEVLGLTPEDLSDIYAFVNSK